MKVEQAVKSYHKIIAACSTLKVGQAVMVLCYKITHKYKELLPFLLYLMIASIYYENIIFYTYYRNICNSFEVILF